MTRSAIKGWQAVQDEVLRRIQTREWRPGTAIPNEADLALEFGCARATVNRALRALAEAGWLDRRRKAGTVVARHPVRKATLRIPLIRQEIEQRGHAYGYRLLEEKQTTPPPSVQDAMQLSPDAPVLHAQALHVEALHLADEAPYVLEDRWINLAAVPAILDADLAVSSANEWLVTHAPFTRGDIAFSAATATKADAELLGAKAGDALFVIKRRTWSDEIAITSVRLTFAPGYRMETTL